MRFAKHQYLLYITQESCWRGALSPFSNSLNPSMIILERDPNIFIHGSTNPNALDCLLKFLSVISVWI